MEWILEFGSRPVRAPGAERGNASYGGSDNLAGLRAGNQFREVGILIDRKFRMQEPVRDALDATSFLILLLQFTRLFFAAFVIQLIVLPKWSPSSVPFSGRFVIQAGCRA